ncbi:MAG TPA: aldolase/citrate lyase family protein [Dehalococcoidia bacterium]|nr:aldolase/citrate lyase family protein [Dehalococcoidia bacterium]
MRENRLKRLWQQGRPALGGWLTVPSAFSAEVFAHARFDWLNIDMQHGLIGYQQAVAMLQAISTTDTVPLVRVPWNEPGAIMKALDAGAFGVIVPLVNSRAEAEAAVAVCRYPPAGIRSYGPIRAVYYAGRDYFSRANEEVLCIVMIETRRALDDLDGILSVPGVDAAYVGPADLSLSLGLPPAADHDEPAFVEALQRIVEACRRHGVVPGFHAGGPAVARKRIEQGFLMIELTDDAGTLARGAAGDLKDARGGAEAEGRGPSV